MEYVVGYKTTCGEVKQKAVRCSNPADAVLLVMLHPGVETVIKLSAKNEENRKSY